ncbi:uncharacterized protein LOC123314342 [Coccinella septempunctata]|uniref:uncharacterized protein LOC123314342 n=1 Tax=Coccinella septempunctata TaxID=41139 RepID=UPI001D05F225|nr:uncharacterized protein LOC123314342 [Coccinella septempunctata]
MKYLCVFVLIALASAVSASEDTFENAGVRVALKLYDDCTKSDGFSPCLKKKALTFLDRLGRMQKLNLAEGVTVTRVQNDTLEPPISEEQLEKSLPRGADAQDQVLNSMLLDKVSRMLSSRSIQVTLPKFKASDFTLEEGRGKKMKGMLGGMMMGIVAKMAALIPVAIAGLFLLAGKALITAKIALLLSGIIALKKLVAAKQSGGHGHSGGHSSGWQSSGGGWDKRSIDEINESQKQAYSAYAPK